VFSLGKEMYCLVTVIYRDRERERESGINNFEK
jgi:hypothetical protein